MAWSPYCYNDHKYWSFRKNAIDMLTALNPLWSIVASMLCDCYDNIETRLNLSEAFGNALNRSLVVYWKLGEFICNLQNSLVYFLIINRCCTFLMILVETCVILLMQWRCCSYFLILELSFYYLSGFYLLGRGGKLPPKRLSFPPPPRKSFPEKNFKAISNKDLFDDDFKESVKVTNVQKCDFSQSWTLYFQKFPGEHAPGPP